MSDRSSRFNCNKNCLQKTKLTYRTCKIKTCSYPVSLFDNNRLQNRKNAKKLEMIIIYSWCQHGVFVDLPSQIQTRMSALKILQYNRNQIFFFKISSSQNLSILKYKTKLYVNLWKCITHKKKSQFICTHEDYAIWSMFIMPIYWQLVYIFDILFEWIELLDNNVKVCSSFFQCYHN